MLAYLLCGFTGFGGDGNPRSVVERLLDVERLEASSNLREAADAVAPLRITVTPGASNLKKAADAVAPLRITVTPEASPNMRDCASSLLLSSSWERKKLAFFTFMSVCIMNYDIRTLSVLKTGAPVFVCILSL